MHAAYRAAGVAADYRLHSKFIFPDGPRTLLLAKRGPGETRRRQGFKPGRNAMDRAFENGECSIVPAIVNARLDMIRKLRWIGQEREAARLQIEMSRDLPCGGVLTGLCETD